MRALVAAAILASLMTSLVSRGHRRTTSPTSGTVAENRSPSSRGARLSCKTAKSGRTSSRREAYDSYEDKGYEQKGVTMDVW